jgi:Flp pilus assembly protein TadD
VALAFGAVARAGSGGGVSVWDDPLLVLYRLGVEALDARDFPRAREIALRAVRECPDQFLAHDLLGRSAFACGLLEEAAGAFAEVLRRYPGSFSARRHLGVVLERLGRTEEAHAAYLGALGVRPDCAEIRRRLQRLAQRQAAVTRASGSP